MTKLDELKRAAENANRVDIDPNIIRWAVAEIVKLRKEVNGLKLEQKERFFKI